MNALFLRAELADNGKDLDNEDLERRHRRKRPQRPQSSPCGGYGGYGKTFGHLGHQPDLTYVSAPVMNYFFGCGVAAVPVAPPIPIVPVHQQPQIPIQGGFGGHHHHHHQHGQGNFGQRPYGQPYGQVPYQGQGYQQVNRPFNNVITAAASGLGTALGDYISGNNRPRKVYKQFNRQVNQLFKPLYQLF